MIKEVKSWLVTYHTVKYHMEKTNNEIPVEKRGTLMAHPCKSPIEMHKALLTNHTTNSWTKKVKETS